MCLRNPKPPWINAEIIKAFNERNKYFKMFRKTRNKHIWEICKYLRNTCNSLVQKAKAQFIKNNLDRNSNDPRKFWKSLNNILKGPKSEQIAHEFIKNTTGEIITGENVCDFLNDFVFFYVYLPLALTSFQSSLSVR